MSSLGGLILGLGLFFVGLRQVEENVRRLSGPSFRALVARTTASPWRAGLVGVFFGALMQSATAVTFILVSMAASGVIAARAAVPVIAWTNVGLTALAFVAALDIHPLVAFVVGTSGILVGVFRRPGLRTVAGLLLGVGFIFFGLETMGAGARPLVATPWFQALLHPASSSPVVFFLVGVAAAVLLQSNTGATMLIITLAGAGAFREGTALMLVYGTNLGAIVLRAVLALGLRGTALQLVRFEDLFCLVSGVVMASLYFLETATGLPLIAAGVAAVSPDIKTQLALGFLLSNLIPALLLSPCLGPCQALLAHLWPADSAEDAGTPKFITPQALAEPGTAIDLVVRELSRLLASVAALLADPPVDESARHQDFTRLASAIDGFTSELAREPLSAPLVERLHRAREELAVIGYLEETVNQLGQSLADLTATPEAGPIVTQLRASARSLLDNAIQAATTREGPLIERLLEQCRRHGPVLEEIHRHYDSQAATGGPAARTALLKVMGDFEQLAWVLRRLAKILAGPAAQAGR
jgi:phosphate:Na+ symporter